MGNQGGAAEVGAHREVEVGCREEEAEMETRGMMRQAEEAPLGLRKENVLINMTRRQFGNSDRGD